MIQSGNKREIMVVDDQPVNLRLMENILTRQGYAVRSFPRGRLALAAAVQKPPDLILLDITMPEMDGFEVCRRLRSNATLSTVPVIFLSALGEKEHKIEAFQSGGLDYVTKPFDVEEVRVRIETQLKLHELHVRAERQNRELERLVKEQVQEIAAGQMATIFALAKLAESRDSDTGRHLERVQMLCRLLAVEMSLWPEYSDTITPDYVQNIVQASPLHDIGKVAIPDSTLLKPGKLTAEEFAVMKTHTVHGAETLQLVLDKHPANPFIRMGIEIARSHHEKWDGSGYPDGLRGTEIPLSARIMSVADYYDALRSQRCYKSAYSHEESRDLIVRETGKHFDPNVVDAFRNVEGNFRQIADTVR
jgi:putative two-component system response regulator